MVEHGCFLFCFTICNETADQGICENSFEMSIINGIMLIRQSGEFLFVLICSKKGHPLSVVSVCVSIHSENIRVLEDITS